MKTKRTTITIGLALCLCGSVSVKAQPLTVFSTPVISGSNVLLNWSGEGTLQTSTDIHGPWVNVASGITATGSATIPLASGAKFARTISGFTASDAIPLLPDGAAPGTPFSPLKILSGTAKLTTPTALANSLVTITVDTNIQAPLSNSFEVFLDNSAVTFTGVGGGVFTGNVLLDTNLMLAANNNLASLLPAQKINFSVDKTTRNVTATNTVGPFAVTNLMAGGTISIFSPFLPCAGVAGAYAPDKTVLITSTSVVNDPTRTWDPCTPGSGSPAGVWTFGFLMSQICSQAATGITPSEFCKNWLESFNNARVINGEVVPANPSVKTLILDPWLAASGLDGGTTLDMNKAPFRLSAIDNRLDLRANATYGGSPAVKNPCDPPCLGGESRFIFCATDPSNPCTVTMPFEVILEYCNPGDCAALQSLAQKWAHLNTYSAINSAYRTELQAITATFSLANAFPDRPPNQSALNQLRVNEFLGGALPGAPAWRLYEFKLAANGSDAGHLRPATVTQTPAIVLNKNVNHTVNAFVSPLKPTVPLFFGPTGPLLASEHALGGWAPTASTLPWDGNATVGALPARHTWALRTCNGCHGSEAPAISFTHVGCRLPGDTATISQFLSGIVNFPDPVSPALHYTYSELNARVQGLNALATCGCNIFALPFDPVVFVNPAIFVNPVQAGNMGTFVH